jgi:hypothetical protein
MQFTLCFHIDRGKALLKRIGLPKIIRLLMVKTGVKPQLSGKERKKFGKDRT